MSRVLSAAIVITILVSACSGGAERRREYWTTRLNSELPRGSALAEVKVFFAKSRLEHSYNERTRTLYAAERDISKDIFVSWSVAIECTLDSADKLQSCNAKVFGTGP